MRTRSRCSVQNGVVYLTTDQVVLINARFGRSVRELSTVDAATMRCAHGYDGTEFHPTLSDKAGALLWALATTQGSTDGNNRTAGRQWRPSWHSTESSSRRAW